MSANLADKILVQLVTQEQISAIAHIHEQVFTRQTQSQTWIQCSFNAFPKNMLYCAMIADKPVGYIIWTQKSGFRNDVVLELEQLAVLPDYQGQGVATALIEQSLQQVKAYLTSQNAKLKYLMVTTQSDNPAQKLYQKTLGVNVVANIPKLFTSDEVVMLAEV